MAVKPRLFNDIVPFNNHVVSNKETNLTKSEFWLNIGIIEPLINKEGIETDTFIGLPRGIPLDTLDINLKNSSSEYFNNIQLGQLDLINWIKEVCSNLEEGEEGYPEGLVIQIKRNKSSEGLSKNEDITSSIRNKLSFKKA